MTTLKAEFLDKILSILKDNEKLTAHQISVLFITDAFYGMYKADFKIDNYLPILLEDGFIKTTIEISDFDNSEILHYSITTKGLGFSGYTRNYYNSLYLEEQNRLLRETQIKLNRNAMTTNKCMVFLTTVLVFCTIISTCSNRENDNKCENSCFCKSALHHKQRQVQNK